MQLDMQAAIDYSPLIAAIHQAADAYAAGTLSRPQFEVVLSATVRHLNDVPSETTPAQFIDHIEGLLAQ